MIIGHRGCAGHAPENTLAGIRWANGLGLRWVELDVSLLSDGGLVMFHDDRLERCTDGSGLLRDHGLKDVERLDAGILFPDRFKGEPVPTLAAALDLIFHCGMSLNLELKVHGDEGADLARAVFHAISHRNDVPPIRFSSFDPAAAHTFRSLSKDASIGLLYERLPADWRDQATSVNASSIGLDAEYVTEAIVRDIKLTGLSVYVFTVNEGDTAKTLFNWGVDGIFSDFPDRVTQKGIAFGN